MKLSHCFLIVFIITATLGRLHTQIVYISEPNWIIKFDVQSCTKEYLCYLPGSYFTDIAFHPNGSLYGIQNENQIGTGLYNIDTSSCTISKVAILPYYTKGLVSDFNGLLYLAENDLISYNPANGDNNFIGKFEFSCNCDLIFYQGELFTSFTYDDENAYSGVFKVNTSNIGLSTLYIDRTFFAGMVAIPYSCDSTIILAFGQSRLNSSGVIQSGLVELDLDNRTGRQLCSGLVEVLGASSPLEFLASDPECDLLLGLDRDNSSGVYPYDFHNRSITCLDSKSTRIVDDDVYLHTSSDLDSVVITLTGDLDGSAESL
ncbi:MAG: hypothetical protein WAU01_12570, partial [Saprospiraceae bacterium]